MAAVKIFQGTLLVHVPLHCQEDYVKLIQLMIVTLYSIPVQTMAHVWIISMAIVVYVPMASLPQTVQLTLMIVILTLV